MKLKFKLPAKSSVFTKFLLSYVTVFTIPLLILGTISYFWTYHIVKSQTERTYLNAVQDVRKTMDDKLWSLSALAISLSEQQWVQKLMYSRGSTVDYTVIHPYSFNYNMRDLNTFLEMNGLIDDMAIYFHMKDIVLSTQGKYSLQTFFEDAFDYGAAAPDDWYEELSRLHVSDLSPPAAVLTYKQPRKLLTFTQSLPMGTKDFNATFIAFISEQSLQESLNMGTISGSGSLYVWDGDGNYISGVHADEGMQELLTARLTAAPTAADPIATLNGADGEPYIVFRAVSDMNEWSYVAAIPTGTAMAKVNQIKLVTLVLTVVSLLIGLVVSYMLALRNYTPLANLVNAVSPRLLEQPSAPVASRQNEFNFLQRAMHAMLEYEDKTKQQIQTYKPLAQNSLFIQLLEGGPYTSDEHRSMLKLLDITFSNSWFTPVSLLLDTEEPLPVEVQRALSDRLMQDKAAVHLVEPGGKTKVLLLNTPSKEQVRHIVDLIRAELDEHGLAFKAIGVGTTCKGLEELGQSYRESNTAMDYRFIRGDSSVIYYSDIEDSHTPASYYYHAENEEHIANHIKCGNPEEAIARFRNIVNENLAEAALTPHMARNLFYNMASTALKALEDMGIEMPKHMHMDDFFQMDTVHEMTHFIEELYREACAMILQEKESRNTQLRDDIVAFIGENLTDSGLTLTSLADRFGLSLSYMSRFIKDQTGTNFVNYMNSRRIELAKPLLLSGMTIREAACEVGFDNDLTFRRLFKKHAGINPGEYRNIDSRRA
ncbi:helix-turn-helix domain-containing protein [Paenibacillus sp. J5C_2022]|uniref:helix-turn-helix domain-containing protein n=1 Tax=Paenibacillus sp. J5C2022 TaxID=2977129 RepID=UPI0021CDF43C|nr:helix-turn-helix domain-containing protein [Paenibacillus sp. J5C2022]MCU6712814.1 helix-turn-helix domain-containing protein [Paenibacillus sp. J5C2022]